MLFVWIACGIAALAVLVILVVVLTRQREEPPPSVTQLLGKAKRALQDQRPTLTLAAKGKDRVPYDPERDNPKKLLKKGVYHLVTPDVFITYTADTYTDEAVVALREPGEKLTLMFAEGQLSGIWIGKQVLPPESFEVRQGRAGAGNLRRLICHHLGLPGGELED